ncbi:recombinase family protein [Legionella fallonii]|uniref:recombinase family protein n=1 Tax=Legionella fallonii TaxID=96230 RepID=UPI0005D41E2B|nr:recombinase family protein [Legionella fallonii]
MKAGIYARVSTHDQQTLELQIEAMKKYAQAREWRIESEISEIGSGAKDNRPLHLLSLSERFCENELKQVLLMQDKMEKNMDDPQQQNILKLI